MDFKNLKNYMLPVPVAGGFEMEKDHIWCGSVVRGEDGRYHMFSSRIPGCLSFHPGWLTSSEIVRAVSDTPAGPFNFQEVVLPNRGPQYWDGRSTHNPHIVKYEEYYLLYYMGTTHPFEDPTPYASDFDNNDPRCTVGRANKRIGLALSKSVFGPWQRFDKPILEPRPDKFDSFFTSNPSPVVHEDGSVLLIYKARGYKGKPYKGYLQTDQMIGVAKAAHFTGPYFAISDTPVFDRFRYHIEDPFVWKTENGYEMIAKDMDGRVNEEKFAGIHAVSKDGIKWDISKGSTPYSLTVQWENGNTSTLFKMERPFLLIENGCATHAFFAVMEKTPENEHRPDKTRNICIPLRTNK